MKFARTDPQGFRPLVVTIETAAEAVLLRAALLKVSDAAIASALRDGAAIGTFTPEQRDAAVGLLGSEKRHAVERLYEALREALK